jgi:hypothetical protein
MVKNCADCNVPMAAENGKCPLCLAFDNGQLVFWESMRFHVTVGRIADLSEWHDGNWIRSEILESHRTFLRTRRAVAKLNEETAGEMFYFITGDKEIVRAVRIGFRIAASGT